VSFNQKLLWKMVNDRRPLLTTFADKVAVRDYVAHAVGPEVLPQLYCVVRDPADLDRTRLPTQFVVKPNHASGLIWIVSEDSTHLESGSSTTHRDSLEWDLLVATCRQWLATSYADVELEWAYRNVPPRILVEELLLGPDGRVPPDYKFFVFHGRVRLVQVDTDRFEGHRRNFYLPDWSVVDAQLTYPPAELERPRPDSLERMLHIAEVLGQGTDFVRVDLYDVAGRILFGELTSYPEAARQVFSPESFDDELGRYWTVPQKYS
jgi:hypothetical protein